MRLLQNCLLLFILFLPFTVTALVPARSDQQLLSLFAKLNSADGYAYRTVVTSQIAGDQKERDTVRMINYQSKATLIVYSKTDDGLTFLCEQGQFRVSTKEKSVYYALFPTDPNQRKANTEKLAAQFTAYSVDSLLLSGATILSKKTANNIIHYKLSYQPGYYITGLDLVYDLQKDFFVSISYEVNRPIAGSGSLKNGELSIMRQKLLMDHYEKKMPPEVANILSEKDNLNGYLEKSYKGYQIQKINL